MSLAVAGLVTLSLFLSGCRARNEEPATPPQSEIESVYTSLGGASCKQQVDKNDPNETTYLVCPGVTGYGLIVRHVDSGRDSIEVVDPSQRVFPLNYQEYITRRMFSLDSRAEWRVATRDGKQVPIALIVRLRAHESSKDPAMVTQTYIAVAKIAPNEACVTSRIPEGSQPDTEVRSAADSAAGKPCLPPQPPMVVGGVVGR